MVANIKNCYACKKGLHYCQLSPSVKGWGCKHLHTEYPEGYITDDFRYVQIPITATDIPRFFAKIYFEAKDKGVTGCPAFSLRKLFKIIEKLK
ncbi:MAG: hypothetical protein RR383_01890 [Muribaculaceae bacterium]